MVALNTAYAAPKNAADPQNRVGDFFYEDHASVGKNRWAKRLNTQEKSSYHYETASGRSNWPNRDPTVEAGHHLKIKMLSPSERPVIGTIGVNRYTFVLNQPIHLIDVDGRSAFKDSPSHNISTAGIMGGLIGELIDLLLGKLCYQEGKEKINRQNDDCERVCHDRANNHQRDTISGHYRAEYKRTCTDGTWGPVTWEKLTDCDAADCSTLGQCYYESAVIYTGLSTL